MPNHLHILFKQIKPISQTIKSLKARSAKEINLLLKKSGKFWASDYYDKVIRDDEHFAKVYKYIQNNALKANLNINERFYSIYT
jgi:REP element-mobilizing transposase RayT